MSGPFDAALLVAEMRTGSNHLETSLEAMGATPLGEAFNPHFLGQPNRTELLGVDMDARASDPQPLVDAILARPGLGVIRYFHDHDPRVFDRLMDDPRIAKVVLSRNPLEAYVSLGIARATDQWRLTNPKMAKAARIVFDADGFDARLARLAAFRARVQRRLQVTGQSAFWIDYEDIGDLEVVNGLGRFLGLGTVLDALPGKLKKQNPGTVEDKVENPEAMRAHLATLDPFGLSRAVHLEPRRVADPACFQIAADSPLVHLPVPGGPADEVGAWLARLDGADARTGFDARGLRPWMRRSKGFVSFSVLPHPLARAWDAWGAVRTARGPRANETRRILRNQHGVDPEAGEAESFLAFLRFLWAVLSGQSALPVAPDWASQAETLAGMAQIVLPQRLIREEDAGAELAKLAEQVGRPAPAFAIPSREPLARIVTDQIEDACIKAYRRDFLAFGFRRWSNTRT